MPTPTIPTVSDPAERAEMMAAAFLAGYRVASTRRDYAGDLRQWFACCHPFALDPLAVRRTHVELFARQLEAEGCAANTVKRKLTSMAMFYQ